MSLDLDQIDWSQPRTPCENEALGCPVPNFHVCLIGKEDRTHEFPDLLRPHIPGSRRYITTIGQGERNVFGSAEHRSQTSLAARARWAAHNASNVERNKKIVEDYKDGLGLREIREKYRIGQATAIKILHAARDEGDLVMRQRGFMEYGQRKQKAV